MFYLWSLLAKLRSNFEIDLVLQIFFSPVEFTNRTWSNPIESIDFVTANRTELIRIFELFIFFLWVFEVRFERTELKIKLYFDQNKVFFFRFLLIFLEMHLHFHTIVVYCGWNCLTFIIIGSFEVRFDRTESNFLKKKTKKINKKFE